MDFDSLDLVGRGVHLGHHDVCVVLVFLSQLVPDWSQLFAVTAPGSVCRKRNARSGQGVGKKKTFPEESEFRAKLKRDAEGIQDALTEFDEDVLGGVKDDLLEVLAHQDFDWALVPVVRNVLAHKVRLTTRGEQNKKTVSGPSTIKGSLVNGRGLGI